MEAPKRKQRERTKVGGTRQLTETPESPTEEIDKIDQIDLKDLENIIEEYEKPFEEIEIQNEKIPSILSKHFEP